MVNGEIAPYAILDNFLYLGNIYNMAEEVITIEDFLEKLTNGDFKQYFDDVCREQNKDIEETTRQIKELFKNEQTLNLKTILDLKNFLKDVLQKHPTRSLLLKKLKFSNGVKYDLHELFFIKSVYLFLRALNSEHSLLKDPLNFINFQIHLNPELNKNVEILYKDGKQNHHRIHQLVAQEFIEKPDGKNCVDHVDKNRLNNIVENLRWVSSSENSRNRSMRSNNTTGYKGVSFYKRYNKYEANISYEGKKHRLGYFETAEQAARAYDAKAKEIDPVHFTLNFN